MRCNNPVVYDDRNDVWGVFRYSDVRFILGNHKYFSSTPPRSGSFLEHLYQEKKQKAENVNPNSFESDPTYQRMLRVISTSVLSSIKISKLEPIVESITHDLVNRVIRKGYMDLINDLAYPLSVSVIANLLGVLELGHDIFRELADKLLRSTTAQLGSASAEEISRIQTRLMYEIHAGHVATVHLIGNAILSLLQNPKEFRKLQEDYSSTSTLISSTIEETLWYRSPVQGVFRTTTEQITLGESELIPPGETVVVWLGSANHDETVFRDPENFDISRVAPAHLGFGHGMHFCSGAWLARLECRVFLRIILDRLKYLQLDSAKTDAMKPLSNAFMHGVSQLPLRFRTGDVIKPV